MNKTAEEYFEEVVKDWRALQYVPKEIQENYPDIYIDMCFEAVKKCGVALEYVSKEIQEMYPGMYIMMCREAVKKDWLALQYVPKEIQEKAPGTYLVSCKEAVEQDWHALEYVLKETKIAYPEICIEGVKQSGMALRYVPKEVQGQYLDLFIGICVEVVKKDAFALEYVAKEVQEANPDICVEAVKKFGYTLQYVAKEVQEAYPKKYIEMCFEAVKQNGHALQYVAKEVQEAYPKKYIEMCLEAAKQNKHALEYVAKEVYENYPEAYVEICLEAVKHDGKALEYVAKEVQEAYQKKYIEMCFEAVKQNEHALEYVAKEVYENYPEKYVEMCLEAVKKDGYALEYVAKEVQEAYPKKYIEICIEAVKQNGYALEYVAKEVQEAYPKKYIEMCFEAVKQNEHALKYVAKEVYENYPEKYTEICIEALKNNLNIYMKDFFYGREIKEVQEWMFEDIERIEKVKAKAEFHLSPNYNERYMDVYYHKMIKTIGYDAIERMIDIPVISQEDIERYNLEYNEKIKELFEIKYKLRGEIGAVVDIFRIIDLGKYASKGKNVQFEVYKKINQMLEEGKISSVEELIKTAMIESGIEVTVEDERRIKGNKDIIVGRLAKERIEKTKGKLIEKIDNVLVDNISITSKKVIERIIRERIIEAIKEGEGKCDVESVKEKIKEELSRTDEEGNPYYTPVIINQAEKMMEVTEEFIGMPEVERELLKPLVEVVREQKARIGKGWIRKIIEIPEELSKEEYDKLEDKLGFKPEATYEARLKDKEKEGEAYKELLEIGVGVITYEQIEVMFGGIREPYSEEFKNFFNKHREEILGDPEIYLNLSKMHNNFDNIMGDSIVAKRYARGEITPKDILRIQSKKPYENIREGNEKLAKVAAKAGLDQKEFEVAQEIYEKTKEREGSTIPPVKVEGRKYRVRILRADDPLNIVVGNITKCCQSVGREAESAMIHSATERNGAVFVVEEIDEEGKVGDIVAQSWTWRNGDTLCFDNIEVDPNISMSEEEHKEVMDLYIQAAEKAIQADEKGLRKLLKEGKISQEVYDRLVLKQVVCGVGYNDAVDLTRRVERGELKEVEKIVLPKEKGKTYQGSYKSSLYTADSKAGQIVLAKMEDEKREEVEERLEKVDKRTEVEMPVIYKSRREVKEYGDNTPKGVVKKIKEIEDRAYREEQKILQGCDDIYEIAETYGLDPERVEVKISTDGDWYMIGEEREGEYYIADMAMIGGLHSEDKGKIGIDSKIATIEMAREMYLKMIEMGEKGKKVRYEATRDTSYINTKRMKEKGLIAIESDEEDRFGNSEIEMNNVTIVPNAEALKEELKKVDGLLDKLAERGTERIIEDR